VDFFQQGVVDALELADVDSDGRVGREFHLAVHDGLEKVSDPLEEFVLS